MPYLKNLKVNTDSVLVMPVFFDVDRGKDVFLRNFNWTGLTGTITRQDMSSFPISGFPTTAVVDSTGKVLSVYVGELNAKQQEDVTKLVSQ